MNTVRSRATRNELGDRAIISSAARCRSREQRQGTAEMDSDESIPTGEGGPRRHFKAVAVLDQDPKPNAGSRSRDQSTTAPRESCADVRCSACSMRVDLADWWLVRHGFGVMETMLGKDRLVPRLQ